MKVEKENINETYGKTVITFGDLRKCFKENRISFNGSDDSLRVILADAVGNKYQILNIFIIPDDNSQNDILGIDIDEIVEESKLNEDKLVETSKWECEVEEDKDGKFSVYEKDGHIWTAAFANKKAAEDFAKNYPEMKEKYLKIKTEDDALSEADDREPLSHALDIVGVKASTANTSGQDEVEMSIIEKDLDDEIEEAIKEIYK